MLDTVVRKLVEYRYERALRQFYLGNSVKIGERQLPDLWAAHLGVCRVLDTPDHYDLYVSSAVTSNARTIGSQHPIIVFDASLLEQLGPGEQRAVLAHEVGHILSDHVLYMTALDILLRAGGNLPSLLGLPLRAVQAVLLEWVRAAELSCDRAATLAVRDPRIVCRTLMVTAGGLPADRLDLDAFMAQAMEYESWDDAHDRVRRFFYEIGATHSYAVRRVSEVMKWVQSAASTTGSSAASTAAVATTVTCVRRPARRCSSTPSASAPCSGRSATTSPRSGPRSATPASRSPTGCAGAASRALARATNSARPGARPLI